VKIRGWSIDGFGIFQDFAVADLPDGLTVVIGANEAGKSTLLEFLRQMLFGPPEHGGRVYLPPPGRPHRGRITLANRDENAELIVERNLDGHTPPTLHRRDGGAVASDALQRLLGETDERLFRSVFAFTLDELQSLANLDVAGVRDALFSATLVGAGRSARAAARTLSAQAAARLEGEGGAQASRLIAELEALRPRLNTARRGALAYAEQRAAADALNGALEHARATLTARRAARLHDDALLRAWPPWEALQVARGELVALEPVGELPADIDVQLNAARERLGVAQAGAQVLRAEQADLERQVASISVTEVSADVVSEIEALHADLSLHRFRRGLLDPARARSAATEQLLREHLERLGTDWNADRLHAWGQAPVDRDSVRDWQARTHTAAEAEQQAQWRLEAAAAAQEAAGREIETARTELPEQEPLDSAEIERRREAAGDVREALGEMERLHTQGETTAQTLQERERALQELQVPREPPLPSWLPDVLRAFAVASGGAGVWGLARGAPVAGIGAMALALAALAIEWWVLARRQAQAERDEENEAAQRAVRGEIEAARRTRDGAWRRAAQLAADAARQAAALGLPRSPTHADLEVYERALDEEEARATRAAAVRGRLAELERVLVERTDDARACSRDAAAAADACRVVDREWAAWRVAAGFAAEATFDGVLERIAALEAAATALAAQDVAARELHQNESLVHAWERRARAVLERSRTQAAAGLDGEAVIERLLALRRTLHEEAPLRARRTALAGELGERAPRLAVAELDVEGCRTAIDELLRAAGAVDEVDLMRRHALAERRRALLRTIAEQERAVAERLGGEAAVEELSMGAVDVWRQRAAAADTEIAALEQRVYELVGECHAARAECRSLEESTEVASLELEWAAVTAELGQVMHDWRVLAAAEGLIDEARQVFERTRQPAVLRAASAVFSLLTGGRYERIAQDEHGETLVVIERGGMRRQVGSELSRGTNEQLYVCIRLGLAQELAARGVALPLVMDDVLVNFDPARARAMAEVLGAIARQQQVLFFTCHPSMGELLTRYGGAELLVEL
jgi:uncharacterized protein YhaN